MFKIDDELRSRASMSKHDKISSKGHKRSVKNASAQKSTRLSNEEKELLKLQRNETFLKERMKPAGKFEYHYKPETMNDGTDVAAKIELNRAKVIAADKRKLKLRSRIVWRKIIVLLTG